MEAKIARERIKMARKIITKSWLAMTEDERAADTSMKTVSARHFTITMFNTSSIEIHNLSPNGTFVDGRKVDRVLIADASVRPHDIKFGMSEVLQLKVVDE